MLRVERNPELDEALETALIQLWTDVSNAGGAVGFVAPVAVEQVAPVADVAFGRVRAGLDDFAVAWLHDRPAGFGFLSTNDWSLFRHWGTIKRLQRHPDVRAKGVGGALLSELEAAALDRGLERLVLTVRGRTRREGFYLAHGYRLEAVLPGRIRVAEGADWEELVMSKALSEAAAAADAAVLGGRGGAGQPVCLPVRLLDPDLPPPSYAQPGDAGLDLRAREPVRLEPGERAVVPTGVAVAIPEGHVGLVHPRSGLAARHGLALVNAPGTIDAGYRGEIKVILVNLDPRDPLAIERGDRIAQLVVQRVERVEIEPVAVLPASDRAEGGFGSTGRS